MWYLEIDDNLKIVDFDIEDEFYIREQCFIEFNDWGTLIFGSLELQVIN